MGFWKNLKMDLKTVFPEYLRIYDDKETGEWAFEIVNKENSMGVPLISRCYENKQRGISLWESTNDKEPTGFWQNVQNKIGYNQLKELQTKRVI